MTARDYITRSFAFARVELCMQRGEFLDYTIREWLDICKAWNNRNEREDRRIARICLVVARCAGNAGVTEDTFLPKAIQDDEEEEPDIRAQFLTATAGCIHNGF